MNTSPPAASALPTRLAAVGLLAVLGLHLCFAAIGAPRFRDQHLGAALDYAHNGIDLLRPMIVGFNANGAATPQEVPVWQALAAWSLRWGGGAWAWANVSAWLIFASCLWPLHRLAAHVLGRNAAGWTALAFVCQPLVILHAGQAGTDGTALAATLWFAYFAHRLIASGSATWWLATALAGALAATQKLPFFMTAAIGMLGFLRAMPARRWVQFAFSGAVAAVTFFAWNWHCERQFLLAEFPLVDLRVADGTPMRDWYFGTWAQRLDPRRWTTGAYRVLTGLFGSFALAVVAFFGIRQPGRGLALWWLAGAALTTAVFTNLVLQHWHYYLMLSPAVAWLVGSAIAGAESHCVKFGVSSRAFALVAAAALALGGVQGTRSAQFFVRDDYPHDIARLIATHTSAADKLLIAGGGWGGEELIRSGRGGLSISSGAQLDDENTFARLRGMGFNHIVLLSQSPRRAAIAVAGGSQTRRLEWPELASPLVRSWPVVLESRDLLIAQLPPSTGTLTRHTR